MRVGLTGGIGSGKSAVSELLAEHGAVVIDADRLARDVVAPGTPGLAEVVDMFGQGVLAPSGELDRAAMGRLAFGDRAVRERLEQIIHPRVRARAEEIEAAAPQGSVVVHDIPLLVETGQGDRFDAVIVVDAPTDTQFDRLTKLRGMTATEARSRIAAQASRETRLAAADHVIVNDKTLEDLRATVQVVWAELSGRGASRR